MRLTIDTSILSKYDISINEFLVLYLSSKDVDIKAILDDLLAKGLLHKDLFSDNKFIVSDMVNNLLSTLIIESDKRVINEDDKFFELAEKLKELYPKGRKPGTTYLWRGSTAEIAKKLKTLVVNYHFKFTEDQVLKAAKTYVSSFNGNYTKMRLLKYFILKAEKDADGNTNVISELMTLIENENQETDEQSDWVDKVV